MDILVWKVFMYFDEYKLIDDKEITEDNVKQVIYEYQFF